MKFVIWGAGTRGEALIDKFGEDVVAVIDNNAGKHNALRCGKKIISLKAYIEGYSEYVILISPLRTDWVEEIILQLKQEGITRYFVLNDCPSEFQAPNDNFKLWKKYISERSDDKEKRCGIYGCTFYSVYLYEYMRRLGWSDLWLIIPSGSDAGPYEFVKELYPDINICADAPENFFDKIFVAVREEPFVSGGEDAAGAKEDFFEFTYRIPEYYRCELKNFKGIHQGDRCFVVATGPSLTVEDINKLYKNKEYAIGMNKLYLMFENSGWRPDYWVGTDPRLLEQYMDDIIRMDVKNKFVSFDYFRDQTDQFPDLYFLHECMDFQVKTLPKFSEDIANVIYDCGTVTYECIQLAAYMGFKEIYLLGVDFSFSENYSDPKNHFTDKYYDTRSKTGYFLRDEQLMAYQSAKKYAEEHGIKIYNATRGGKLEVFERVDFDSLFG